jgi:hypothetical protein
MFPINFASVTAEITMYSRHVTKMDIYLFLLSHNCRSVVTEKSWPQRRTVFRWESDDLLIWGTLVIIRLVMEVNKVLQLFLTTSQIIIIASEYQPTLGRRVLRYQRGRQLLNRWESDDLLISTHNFQHNKNNAMFQRDLSRVSCETS